MDKIRLHKVAQLDPSRMDPNAAGPVRPAFRSRLGKALADYYRSHIERWADALGQEPQWLAERLFNQVLFNQRLEDLQYD